MVYAFETDKTKLFEYWKKTRDDIQTARDQFVKGGQYHSQYALYLDEILDYCQQKLGENVQ